MYSIVKVDTIECVLPTSEMTWRNKPRCNVKLNDEIEAVVVKIENGQVMLSIKRLDNNPWNSVKSRYTVGNRLKVSVVNITNNGAFVELEPEVIGFIHKKQLSFGWVKDPNDFVSLGQTLDAEIIELDYNKQKISLSLLPFLTNPWDNVSQNYTVGQVLTRKIKRIQDYGVFVELEPGLDVLYHRSEMDIVKGSKLKDLYCVGDSLVLLINNSISFTSGYRYEDFDSTTQAIAYNSVSEFLQGVPAGTVGSTLDGTSLTEDSPLSPFISFLICIGEVVAVIVAIIVAIMLLLMLAVALTNNREETTKDIAKYSINVLLRIGVFGMVYLLFVMLAIFFVLLGILLTIYVLCEHLSIKGLIVILGGWSFIGSFIWSVVKSLFVVSRSAYPTRLEISQSDAPNLFALIDEISKSVGEKMPKRVYVMPEVNARVFYNNPLSYLFISRRKNLEVGLGLLFGLNKQEFKAVIAHEYGHFGQNSMRVGQIVSICYNIISNLVNSEQTSILRPVLKITYEYVQRGYMALSRSMEYEADEKGAKIAGNDASISALCKIEIMSERFNAYDSFVHNIYESRKKLPTTFWNGYKQFLTLTDDFDAISIDETVTVTEPISNVSKSRVCLKNPWISHPSLEQRIDNIRSLNYTYVNQSKENIQDVVSLSVYEQTSQKLFANVGYASAEVTTDSDYKDLIAKEIEEKSFPMSMRAFFNRDLCSFKVIRDDEIRFSKGFDDVFSKANANFVESFLTAVSDYQLMVMFKNKQIPEKYIRYDGKVYDRKNVPIETQLEIVKGLESHVTLIDKNIYIFALTTTRNRELINKAYDDIFYSQAIIRHIRANILPLRDSVAGQIGKGGNLDSKTFERLQQALLNFKANLIELIDKVEISRLNPVMHVDTVNYLKHIEDNWLLEGPSIISEEIQYILGLPDTRISLFRSLAYYSKKIVSDTIEGKLPLMYWNNSVAALSPQP